MKRKIQEEENLAQAYGEIGQIETSVDDEINKAIGVNLNVQNEIEAIKQKLLANPQACENDDVDKMKKELDK